ncbi:MAG: aminoacyl-tRNA hydrolase [Candidatus Magasanikbacteria bacterium]|nr:aminoacyl-tRNA hydrolase [Candidatus Magasanikbacteria bacterium]
MKLIVALGNPGKNYARTRHNVGWLFLDWLFPKAKWQASAKAKAEYLKTEINGQRAEIIKPQTFMNNSGIAVAYAANKNGVKLNDIIVIHDDKDISLGATRVQQNRGAGGHNGVASIIEKLGSKNFTRIRIGIAPTDNRIIEDTANFVLSKLTATEQKTLKTVFANIKQELEAWVLL